MQQECCVALHEASGLGSELCVCAGGVGGWGGGGGGGHRSSWAWLFMAQPKPF